MKGSVRGRLVRPLCLDSPNWVLFTRMRAPLQRAQNANVSPLAHAVERNETCVNMSINMLIFNLVAGLDLVNPEKMVR